MSRGVAKVAINIINVLTLPFTSRQKKRIVARTIAELEKGSLRSVSTNNGELKFLALKSAFVASAVERFHIDEPETLEWIDGFNKGETFWDVGANIGLYSLYAGLTQKVVVYAFEPSGINYGLLVEHIKINKMGDKVKPFCIALSDHISIEDLYMSYSEVGHSSNSLGVARNQVQDYTPKFIQSTPAFSIDGFIKLFDLTPPDHLKIDVDGIEPLILSGAKDTLSRVKDVLVEVEGSNLEHVEEQIEKPLIQSGMREQKHYREKGSKRNRLYSRM